MKHSSSQDLQSYGYHIFSMAYHCVSRVLTAENFAVIVSVLGVCSTVERVKMIMAHCLASKFGSWFQQDRLWITCIRKLHIHCNQGDSSLHKDSCPHKRWIRAYNPTYTKHPPPRMRSCTRCNRLSNQIDRVALQPGQGMSRGDRPSSLKTVSYFCSNYDTVA